MSEPLNVTALGAGYGRKRVVEDLSLQIGSGECVALLGANGAGKTTLLSAICGLVQVTAGDVSVAGVDITGWPPHRIGRGHVALVPEGRHVFATQSVEGNLEIGAFHLRRDRHAVQARLREVYDIFPVLAGYRHRAGSELSGGEQQMLAIGRALMATPKVLLLDEPSLGLSPMMVESVFERLAILASRDLVVLFVEQRVQETLQICDRAYVMERGTVVMEGTSDEIRNSSRLVNAYLGEADGASGPDRGVHQS